jgi:hypothetical protein
MRVPRLSRKRRPGARPTARDAPQADAPANPQPFAAGLRTIDGAMPIADACCGATPCIVSP